MASRFDNSQAYAIEGDLLRKLERVAVRLGAEKPITWQEGRRLSGIVIRVLDTATQMERYDAEDQ